MTNTVWQKEGDGLALCVGWSEWPPKEDLEFSMEDRTVAYSLISRYTSKDKVPSVLWKEISEGRDTASCLVYAAEEHGMAAKIPWRGIPRYLVFWEKWNNGIVVMEKIAEVMFEKGPIPLTYANDKELERQDLIEEPTEEVTEVDPQPQESIELKDGSLCLKTLRDMASWLDNGRQGYNLARQGKVNELKEAFEILVCKCNAELNTYYQKCPLDKNRRPIHIGDVVETHHREKYEVEFSNERFIYGIGSDNSEIESSLCEISAPDTLEDLLQQFGKSPQTTQDVDTFSRKIKYLLKVGD